MLKLTKEELEMINEIESYLGGDIYYEDPKSAYYDVSFLLNIIKNYKKYE